jgi:hypothetical protein
VRLRTARLLSAACSLLLIPVAGCRGPLTSLGGQRALDHAGILFASLGARVTNPDRDYKYDTARVKIANAALLPSRVWNDTAVWTSSTQSRRTLLIGGRFADGRYRLQAARSVPPPSQAAESRHQITLTRLSDDVYAWDTEVPYAIGPVTAREIGAFVGALFASAEGRSEQEVRADYRAASPRMTAVLGMLFTVDSIRTSVLPDRSTTAAFTVTMRPAGVEKRYPNFAAYLRQYIGPATMKWAVTDRAGATYLTLAVADGRLHLRVRTLDGVMHPLAGPLRAIPDTLRLIGDVTAKVRRLNVGVRGYRSDLVVVKTEHERAWSITSREEPQWTLPLVSEHLLRTPLRRPFQGRGFQFRIGVRDSANAQTLLHRRMHLEVEESAILRFIGKLGAIAIGDYQGKAEREQLDWLREVFDGLLLDVEALAARPGTTKP